MTYRFFKTTYSGDLKIDTYIRLMIILTIVISVLITTPLAAAGSELDDFEEAATMDQPQPDDEKDENDDDADDEDGNFLLDFFGIIFEETVSLFFIVIHDGAKMSLARVDESTGTVAAKIDIRQNGEPTLPFFQVDHKYLRVSPDINAVDNSLEIGYGPFGFKCRNTRFEEKKPADEMSLTQYHLLLRISGTRRQEFGLGIGALNIRGNEDNSGLSLTFPIKVYPKETFGVCLEPTFSWINGNSIRDYDLSVAYTKRYGSLELGYRFLEANGVDLDGPYIGLAVHY